MKTLFKIIVTLFSFTFISHASMAEVRTLDIAVEMKSLKAEYIESSKRGIIYVYNCDQCKQTSYKFEELPIIKKDGKSITFKNFLTDYRNAKYPTLLLHKENKTVLQIIY